MVEVANEDKMEAKMYPKRSLMPVISQKLSLLGCNIASFDYVGPQAMSVLALEIVSILIGA